MKINLKIVKLVAVVFMMALTAVLMMSCGGGRRSKSGGKVNSYPRELVVT